MDDWTRYKERLRADRPELKRDIDEIEELSAIISAMISRRKDLKLSQRDLASLCGLPHSSVARIESGATAPNLLTLLKLFGPLGLKLTVQETEALK